jgi:methionine-R-sulfoxide reductase
MSGIDGASTRAHERNRRVGAAYAAQEVVMPWISRLLPLAFVFAACTARSSAETPRDDAPIVHRSSKPSDAVLRKELTHTQYAVTQKNDTEMPFHNAYWDNHAPGIYVDVVTGEPLFSSTNKFDSGTGWPSFYKSLAPVVEKRDSSLGVTRVEVRSKLGDSHLGHLFDDGPAPTGLRYCINSASLRFVPATQLEAQGYGEYAKLFAKRG